MTQDNLKELVRIVQERMEIQHAQDADDPEGKEYSEEEHIAFALEEAQLNGELDFLCEVAYYQCKDETCVDDAKQHSTEKRDAATLQEAGDPYCFVCGGDMEAITAEAYKELNK